MNHNIYGYNVSNYVNYNRAVAQQKAAQQQRGTAYTTQKQTVNTTVPRQPQKAGKNMTPAQRPTTTKQTTAQPSKAQQDAVNRYVEMMAQQKGQTTPVQKRKV